MKRAKKYKTILPAVMTVVICMVGGITTFAYDSPLTIYNLNSAKNYNEANDFRLNLP